MSKKRRLDLDGGTVELIVDMLLEDGTTTGLDIYVELEAIGRTQSLRYVKNTRAIVSTTILQLQRQRMVKRTIIPMEE